jgi:spoIIIJ-associated protein
MEHEKIKKTIEDLFKLMSCTISNYEFKEEDQMYWCSVETPDSGFMIGRDGETLKSLNHLIQKMTEKDINETTPRIILDVNGYQKKHFENLKNTAHMMAERARYFKSNIEFDPMTAFDRRIIHLFLEGAKDIKTESEGFGPERRVVIKYINQL